MHEQPKTSLRPTEMHEQAKTSLRPSEMHEQPKTSLRPAKENASHLLAPSNIREEDVPTHSIGHDPNNQGLHASQHQAAAGKQGCFPCKDALPTVGSYGMISLMEFMQAEGGPRPHPYKQVNTTSDALGFVTTNLRSLWDSAVNALPTSASSGLITVDTSGCDEQAQPKNAQSHEVVELHRSNAFNPTTEEPELEESIKEEKDAGTHNDKPKASKTEKRSH
jgi:hypothetical protein